MTDEAVRIVGGIYRVGSLLGSGGMGEVYAATGPAEQPVALKFLRAAYAHDADTVARFRRESRIASRIQSPRVARVLGAGKDRDGLLWIAFERLWGEPLEARLMRDGALPTGDVAWVIQHVLEGLAAAHAIGAVHRDVKPGNVFLEAHPAGARLLDFGVSKLRDPAIETQSPNLTDTDQALGTPVFMAPEQALGVDVDARADLYSAGAVAFVSLAGKLPFAAQSSHAIQHAKRYGVPLTLKAVTGREWPHAFEDFVRVSLERDPTRRFDSATAALAAWQRAIASV